MEKDKRSAKRILIGALPLIIVLVITALAFVRFLYDNSERISVQNESYLVDLTKQRAIMIDNLFEENLRYIQTTAFLYGKEMTPETDDHAAVDLFEQSTGFEMLRFLDADGNDYTSDGLAANVGDRDYFKAGMNGETGVTFVESSRVTGKPQIGFYTPVYYDDNIIGVMVGFYGEAFINELIDFELFGYKGEGWLCFSDGTVIDTTSEDNSKSFFEHVEGSDEEDLQKIKNAFKSGSNILYSHKHGNDTVSGYIAHLNNTDWVLIRSFPADAAKGMLDKANNEGIELLIILVVLFTVYALFLVIRFIRQRKRMIEQNRNANDISYGVSSLFEKFQTVDFRDETYNYIKGVPDDPKLALHGKYEDFTAMLLARIKDDKERAMAAQFIAPDSLREKFAHSDIQSIRLHAPIYEDEWFTYNFIALERNGEDVSRMLIIRQNVTDLHSKEEAEQQKLKTAYERAEKASKAKSDFLANMSHDIRTPLNAVIGFTNIAKEKLDDKKEVSDCLDKISASGHHLLSLINDILDMSKIESGSVKLEPAACDIISLINDIREMEFSESKAKTLTLTADTSRIVHSRVIADEVRLKRVLLNIIGNAVKYTPAGGKITITAAETEQTDSSALYTVSVKDTGIGMSKEYLPHVFDSFTRERTSTVDKIQGTGLGMAISYKIITMMNGTISVESEEGKGSEFTICVRLELAKEEARENNSAEERSLDGMFAGKRILLTEDNDMNAQIASFVLTKHGFTVDRCVNGRDAVEKLREVGADYYSIVLMDIQMPVMNGYEASKAIRELGGGYSALPIIAMTANTFEDDKKNAYDAGMNAHISKPFEIPQLIKTLTEYL